MCLDLTDGGMVSSLKRSNYSGSFTLSHGATGDTPFQRGSRTTRVSVLGLDRVFKCLLHRALEIVCVPHFIRIAKEFHEVIPILLHQGQ